MPHLEPATAQTSSSSVSSNNNSNNMGSNQNNGHNYTCNNESMFNSTNEPPLFTQAQGQAPTTPTNNMTHHYSTPIRPTPVYAETSAPEPISQPGPSILNYTTFPQFLRTNQNPGLFQPHHGMFPSPSPESAEQEMTKTKTRMIYDQVLTSIRIFGEAFQAVPELRTGK